LSIPYMSEALSMPEKIISVRAWVLTVPEAFIMSPMEVDRKPFKEKSFNDSWMIVCLRFIKKKIDTNSSPDRSVCSWHGIAHWNKSVKDFF
jgi:hypothetical protein